MTSLPMQDKAEFKKIEDALAQLRKIANDPETRPDLRKRLLELLVTANRDLIRFKAASEQ